MEPVVTKRQVVEAVSQAMYGDGRRDPLSMHDAKSVLALLELEGVRVVTTHELTEALHEAMCDWSAHIGLRPEFDARKQAEEDGPKLQYWRQHVARYAAIARFVMGDLWSDRSRRG